ncbi:MAG: hypothetical protein Q4A17_06970 [Thermoguttaceae bacterium]|nr:hypothetical protein [Thermoguttaceae bacterium]
MKRICISLFLCLFMLSSIVQAKEEDSRSRPYIPASVSRTQAIGVGVATATGRAVLTDRNLVPLIAYTRRQAPWLLNHFKGDLGESLMEHVFTGTALKGSGGWGTLTPARIGRTGIDGLFIKMDSFGNPRQLLVSDAKVGSSVLGMTKDGKQMSATWIRRRLGKTAQNYTELAENIDKGKLQRVKFPPKNVKNVMTVQLDDSHSATVWKTAKGYSFSSADDTLTSSRLAQQARRTGKYLAGAADGKINYRSRLFTYKPMGDQHVIIIRQLDENGNVIRGATQKIQGTFKQLPKEYQRAIRHTAVQTLGRQNHLKGEALKRVARECCENPEKFNQLCMKPRYSFEGLRAGITVGVVAGVTVAIDILTQYYTRGEIDYWQTAETLVLAGTSTYVGNVVGAKLATIGFGTNMSALVGGSVAGVLMAYGMYAMGYCSFEDATVTAYLGAATTCVALTPAIMTSIAVLYGTTSAGVAISTLHGVAAANAVLAWWGGGALAAGGAGMAGGHAAIIYGTGGTALVVYAPVIVYMTWKYFADRNSQYQYMKGLAERTLERVTNNDQPEWSHLPVIKTETAPPVAQSNDIPWKDIMMEIIEIATKIPTPVVIE